LFFLEEKPGRSPLEGKGDVLLLTSLEKIGIKEK
jgi:hypothetical protein